MKKTVVLLLSAVLLLTCGSVTAEKDRGWKNAHEVIEDIVIGWNIGNTMDAFNGAGIKNAGLSSETCWGNPKITGELLDLVKANGFNAIRLPVTWGNHITDQTNMTIDEKWMDRVEAVVKMVLDRDMYCILNMHHDTGSEGWLTADDASYDTAKAGVAAIWKQIAERFEPYGEKLLFESFNEILNNAREWNSPATQSLDCVNKLNRVFVNTVRASGGNNAERVLIVNTYAAAANNLVLGRFVMPNDPAEDRVIVEVHVYAPYAFTASEYPATKTWRKGDIDPVFREIENRLTGKGIPVLIGEFGTVNTKDNRYERLTWAKYMVETARKYGIPCIWWDNGADFGIFNRKTNTVSDPEMVQVIIAAANGEDMPLSSFEPGDLNENGIYDSGDTALLKEWLQSGSGGTPNCDLNFDAKVDAADLALLEAKVTQANNMCADHTKWNVWVDSAAGAAAKMSYTSSGFSLRVTEGGADRWSVQPMYPGLKLEKGKTYTVSFNCKSDIAQTVKCNLQQNYGDYEIYRSFELRLEPDIKRFETEFTMDRATDGNVRLSFDIGGPEAPVPFTMIVSQVTVSEK
ncbi:MAG: cellulase family glycosylhydrolase [Clostridia bacterium]|nr:cellulase family glycosylhydrolase [Clostridia bacterium]